jgi:hypothetical protein
VADWKVVKAWNHEADPGGGRDVAKTFVVSDEGREFQITLEYTGRTAVGENAAGHAARRLLMTVLEQEETPPRRVLVDPDGSYTVIDPASG